MCRLGCDRMVVGYTTTCVFSAYHRKSFVSSNPLHNEGYSNQHYVIKFSKTCEYVGVFFPDTSVSSINKTDHHDRTEILLKVTLNTINNHPPY